jgi:hypothetical protein
VSHTRTLTVLGMQLNALFARNLWEQIQQAARLAEKRTREDHYAIDAFDIGSLPILKTKAYPGIRDVTEIDLVVGHVTDVRDGFGVQKWGPTGWHHWRSELEAGRVSSELLGQLRRPMEPLELAKRVALWSRYRNTPYHEVGAGNGDVLDNRPLHSRTKASSAGNDGVAFAIDCSHKQDISVDMVKTGQLAFRRLVRRLREAGNKRKLRYASHRCFDADRLRDTDRIVHLQVVKPAIVDINREDPYGIEIDYEVALGGGRPISTRDDPEALFDDKGRRVA